MYKIVTEDSKVVYLSLDAVKEIVVDSAQNDAVIYTDVRSYKVTAEAVQDLINARLDNSSVRLISAINNLTQILRARLR